VTEALKKLRVLVVDDNQHMRAIVGAILKSAGITATREAREGGQALAILKDFPADVAIVDFQMAPMDGLEFTRQLRDPATSPNPTLPIIMITGHADAARVARARDAGVNEFLVKPVTARGVLDRLHAAVFIARKFITATTYVGPDRRRLRLSDPRLPRRRESDANATRE
jgi:two-component system chemotaxis response regulator CheY